MIESGTKRGRNLSKQTEVTNRLSKGTVRRDVWLKVESIGRPSLNVHIVCISRAMMKILVVLMLACCASAADKK